MEAHFITLLSLMLVFTFFTTYIGIWIFLNSRFVKIFIDIQRIRNIHQNYTPRSGGICIVISFLCTLLLWNFFFKSSLPFLDSIVLYAILTITSSVFIVGFLDDSVYVVLRTKYKLISEICITTVVAFLFHYYLTEILVVPGGLLSSGWLVIPITVLWITGVTNSIKIIDGIDGLAGLVILISFIGVAVLAGLAGQFDMVMFCIICIALVLGFLPHNISPARIFLGDTGSLFFGIVLGLLTIYLVTLPNANYSMLVAPLLVGFPLLDIISTIIRRFVKSFLEKKPIFQCIKAIFIADNEHIHHRLLYKGLNQKKIVIIVSIFSITLVSSAVLISIISAEYVLLINCYLFIMTNWFLIKMHFFDRIFSTVSSNRAFHKNGINKFNINVINADEILQHSLREFDQNILSFQFQEKQGILKNSGNVDATLFVNELSDDLKSDVDLILSKKLNKNSSVFVAVDKSKYDNLSLKSTPKNIEFFSRDSLYIPYLLDIIHSRALSRLNSNIFKDSFALKDYTKINSIVDDFVQDGKELETKIIPP